jgi:hypothetical protein
MVSAIIKDRIFCIYVGVISGLARYGETTISGIESILKRT